MKILASYNIKGGVGKTSTVVNLAYLAAREGARTLLWDLDPQGAATFYYRVRPKVKGGGKGLVRGRHELEAVLKGTDYPNLDLLPADFSYRKLDLFLDAARKPRKVLKKRLQPLAEEYDYVFLDCAPSISLVSESVLRAADVLIMPLIPTTLSLRTFDQLSAFMRRKHLDGVSVLVFFSMYDRRKRLHREIMEQLPQTRDELLRSSIPFASEVERMGLERQPLERFAPYSAAAAAYRALWREIEVRLRGPVDD